MMVMLPGERTRNLDLVRIRIVDPLRCDLGCATRHRRLQFSADISGGRPLMHRPSAGWLGCDPPAPNHPEGEHQTACKQFIDRELDFR
jgi:hypothetical protein